MASHFQHSATSDAQEICGLLSSHKGLRHMPFLGIAPLFTFEEHVISSNEIVGVQHMGK
jgi:hypothetical protein